MNCVPTREPEMAKPISRAAIHRRPVHSPAVCPLPAVVASGSSCLGNTPPPSESSCLGQLSTHRTAGPAGIIRKQLAMNEIAKLGKSLPLLALIGAGLAWAQNDGSTKGEGRGSSAGLCCEQGNSSSFPLPLPSLKESRADRPVSGRPSTSPRHPKWKRPCGLESPSYGLFHQVSRNRAVCRRGLPSKLLRGAKGSHFWL